MRLATAVCTASGLRIGGVSMGLTTRLQSMVPPAAKMVVSKQPSIRKLLRRVLPWEPRAPSSKSSQQERCSQQVAQSD
eukprot:scaffold78194_cov69-Phaeocystis_antarctica.AAC.6